MYIQNATYKTIPTEGLTFPLEAGTVLTIGNVTGIVPENVAVAAPTGVLYLAVGGTIDLTSEANAGITFTDAELNALSGDFNFIPLAEAGGGGLPEYALSDADKVLTVAEDAEHGSSVDAVPQQTVTTSSGQASLSDVVSDAFVGGRSGVMTINGTDYNVTVVDFGEYQGVFYPDADNPTYSIYMDGEFDATLDDGDYSVSLTLSIPEATAEWQPVVNFIMIDSVGSQYTAINSADFAIIDNGTELATENAVRAYLSKMKNKVCFVKFVDHWNTSSVFPVVYIGDNYVEFIDCGSPNIQVFRNAGFVENFAP